MVAKTNDTGRKVGKMQAEPVSLGERGPITRRREEQSQGAALSSQQSVREWPSVWKRCVEARELWRKTYT